MASDKPIIEQATYDIVEEDYIHWVVVHKAPFRDVHALYDIIALAQTKPDWIERGVIDGFLNVALCRSSYDNGNDLLREFDDHDDQKQIREIISDIRRMKATGKFFEYYDPINISEIINSSLLYTTIDMADNANEDDDRDEDQEEEIKKHDSDDEYVDDNGFINKDSM